MRDEKDEHRYDDIINLPHHQSKTRPHMSMYDRAAQFSPFAALTGYDAEVKEAARLTDRKIELSEEMQAALSDKLTYLRENSQVQPEVEILYFVRDEKKAGGAYVTEIGAVKRVDEVEGVVVLQNRVKIPIEDIADISGEAFKPFERA